MACAPQTDNEQQHQKITSENKPQCEKGGVLHQAHPIWPERIETKRNAALKCFGFCIFLNFTFVQSDVQCGWPSWKVQ